MEELLQKHRTFTLSVAVGGFVFLIALLVRGCAVYDRDLSRARTNAESKARELNSSPVPDRKYLAELDQVVKTADARVADLAREVGHTERGERLWEDRIRAVLRVLDLETPERVKDIMDRARRLPSAAFAVLLEEARGTLVNRASQADVEIAQSQDLGFERVNEADFTRNLAALAAVVRVVDRAIREGVDRVEVINVGGSVQSFGGSEAEPFVRSQPIRFKFRGDPAVLSRVLESVNDRIPEGRGHRLVLDEITGLGRPLTVRGGEAGTAEFVVRVLLMNLEAVEEETP